MSLRQVFRLVCFSFLQKIHDSNSCFENCFPRFHGRVLQVIFKCYQIQYPLEDLVKEAREGSRRFPGFVPFSRSFSFPFIRSERERE